MELRNRNTYIIEEHEVVIKIPSAPKREVKKKVLFAFLDEEVKENENNDKRI